MKRAVLTSMLVVVLAAAFLARPAAGAEMGPVRVHGFVSLGHLYSDEVNFMGDSKDGTWEFNEIGINFQSQPSDRLRLGVQLFSRDLGYVSNNEVQVDWAVADYQFADELGLQFGILKTPRGLYHDQIDLDMTRSTVFLPLSVYDPMNRDLYMNIYGLSMYGNVGLDWMGSIEYIILAGTHSPTTGIEVLEVQLEPIMDVEDIGMRTKYGGRLIWHTPLDGLLLGGSFFKQEDYYIEGPLNKNFTAPNPLAGGMSLYPAGTNITVKSDSVSNWYVFSQYSVDRLTITSEAFRLMSDWNYETSQPFNPALAPPGYEGFPETEIRYGGWYAQVDYQVNEWFTGAVAYSEEFENWDEPTGGKSDPFHAGFRRDTTVSTRFDISPNWNFKLEAHFMDGTYKLYPQLQDDPDDIERYWNLYAAKTTFYF
jgi:hypothetical protein